jgi:hypothetical protein
VPGGVRGSEAESKDREMSSSPKRNKRKLGSAAEHEVKVAKVGEARPGDVESAPNAEAKFSRN